MGLDYTRFFVQDPQICDGEPVIRSTRVPIRTVLASLAEGATVKEILDDFPSLTEESVRAVIAFAAVSAAEYLNGAIPLAARVGHLRGQLASLPEDDPEPWRRQIKERNWRS